MMAQQGSGTVPVSVRSPEAIIHGSARLLPFAPHRSWRAAGQPQPPTGHRGVTAHAVHLLLKALRALTLGAAGLLGHRKAAVTAAPVIRPRRPGAHRLMQSVVMRGVLDALRAESYR